MRIAWFVPLALLGLAGCINNSPPPDTTPKTTVVTPAPSAAVVTPAPGTAVVTTP